jgi:hypothetical protein
MVNPIVPYVSPALPVLQASSTALAPYQPSANADPFAVSRAIDVQILSPNSDQHPGGGGGRWSASGGGPGWWNEATPGEAASAYATTGRMSAGTPPNGQLMDMSV